MARVVADNGEVRADGQLVGRVGDEISASYPPGCITIDPDSGALAVQGECVAQKRIGGE